MLCGLPNGEERVGFMGNKIPRKTEAVLTGFRPSVQGNREALYALGLDIGPNNAPVEESLEYPYLVPRFGAQAGRSTFVCAQQRSSRLKSSVLCITTVSQSFTTTLRMCRWRNADLGQAELIKSQCRIQKQLLPNLANVLEHTSQLFHCLWSFTNAHCAEPLERQMTLLV